mmetsp:Transcript_24816/g.40951  ORF Transcript_24816/g.40951 Transcript_24816/m.40951 type:complete len:735 (+) Transcript_24816:149-2353(+)
MVTFQLSLNSKKIMIMMKLLLLATTMATTFGVAVADSMSIRGNYLRQNHEDRLLKKEEVAAEIIQSNQEEEEDAKEIDWEQFEADIAAEIQAKQEEEIDWNAFAADLVSAGLVTTPQPTVDVKTVKPSVSPTQAPTSLPSKEPTMTPTKKPSDNNATPAPTMNSTPSDKTILPTIAVSSMTAGGGDISFVTPSAKPTKFNFVFSFGDTAVTKVTLPSFRLDFVATTNMSRNLRRDELMTGDEEQTFIEIISNQIMSYLQDNLSREVVSVDLNVEDKRENHFPQMVMFSYDLGGAITFVGGEDELPPLPTPNELATEVLGFLETDSFVEELKSFDSSGLLNIDDVVASIPSVSGTASKIQITDSTGIIPNSSKEGDANAVGTPVVIAFVTAFAFTMAVIGFVTLHKLRKYQGNEDDESSGLVKATYQNIKEKFNSVTPMGRTRQYNHFESPLSSEHSIFGGIEESGAECPIVSNVDRERSSSQPLSSKYLSDEAFLAESESDTTSERGQQNLTLDFLYSDTDSYFSSSIGTSNFSVGVRPRLLSKDLVYSDTDSSLRSGSELDLMKNNPYSANMHSISKVSQLLLYNDDAAPSDSEITEADSAAQEEDADADKSKEENHFARELTVTDDLFARLNELENKIVLLGDSKNAYSEAEDSAEKLDVGAFSDETLDVLQRDRLRCTPPPSETELDGVMIDCSKNSSLLGNVLDESDGDDDELLFEGSISTIESEIDSNC